MRLVVLEIPNVPPGTLQAHQFDFDTDPDRYIWVIGRQLGSDIHLVDPSVSRRHAELEVRPDGFLARDLGSSNGTFINDQRLQPHAPRLLRPGDRLRVGNVLTLLEESSLAGRTPPPPADIQIPAARPKPQINQAPGNYAASARPQSPRGDLPPANPGLTPAASPAQPIARNRPPVNPDIAPEGRPALRPAGPGNFEVAAGNYYEQPGNAAFPPPPPPAPPAQLFTSPDQPGNGKGSPSSSARAARGEYYPPVQAAPHIAGLKPPPVSKEPGRGIPRSFFIIAGLIVVLIVAGVIGFLLLQKSPVDSPPLPAATLPLTGFKSPSAPETVLGLNLAHPANWKRNDVSANQIIFYQPDVSTTILNLEKPPSRTITDAGLSPEAAIRQYVSNVKQNATKSEVKQEPASAKLKDGTPAVLTRLIFSTNSGAIVTDYNMYAVSFKCGDTLYFASAAAEGKNYNADLAQDLDAAIGSLTCAK
jgi:hypothetical protein